MKSRSHNCCTRICTTRVLLLELLLISRYAMADSADQKCAATLAGLRTCTPYVEGNAKAPQPECCKGLKEAVINNRMNCLCIIIKNFNDSSLGVNINLTLAFNVPVYCKVPANKSQCSDNFQPRHSLQFSSKVKRQTVEAEELAEISCNQGKPSKETEYSTLQGYDSNCLVSVETQFNRKKPQSLGNIEADSSQEITKEI
ncbi:hypothetical protein L6164_008353 [Bauhinia variegata]|uniref:Uncharacterized protein n=1 Tax=Bauhinia variegata TaxID=167791 RepID=A0ACB9PG84_BAUVA|nr:hypothetical protein L6164_008353 [Bauhinia variegata]